MWLNERRIGKVYSLGSFAVQERGYTAFLGISVAQHQCRADQVNHQIGSGMIIFGKA